MTYHPYDPRMGHDPARKLSDGEVQARKPEGWWGDDGKLFRDVAFDTYQAGVDFVVQVAALAEQRGHHPDLHLRYRRVRVTFFTYAAGGVTQLDLDGAQAINALLERFETGEAS
ncbi:4a-hydroxytetrahydrobiopterin dehydratase [Deinococcus hohokamensis]|uniref:4a-hydroxytetrahydrobiopterin dehydratase n=1 Tax=Deinococcus hohokamensis TaxID=309883 RepID=A0ABV9I648_9DEIO